MVYRSKRMISHLKKCKYRSHRGSFEAHPEVGPFFIVRKFSFSVPRLKQLRSSTFFHLGILSDIRWLVWNSVTPFSADRCANVGLAVGRKYLRAWMCVDIARERERERESERERKGSEHLKGSAWLHCERERERQSERESKWVSERERERDVSLWKGQHGYI